MKKILLIVLILIASGFVYAQDGVVRESTEWTYYWRDSCNDYSKPRVLMIGDSICNAYRDTLNNILKDEFQIDKVATSRSLDQKLYFDQLNVFLSDTKYDMIIFNFGLHGFHIKGAEYYKGMDKLCKILKSECSKVYCLGTTPLYYADEKKLKEENKIVIERNVLAKKAAEKNKIGFIDWYDMWLRPELRGNDPYHYNAEGSKLQAEFLAGKIREFYKK